MKNSITLLIAFTNIVLVQAQDNSHTDSLKKGQELVLFVERTYTNLINYNVIDDQAKSIHNAPGINIGGSYIFYFQDRWGVSVGLGVSSFRQSIHQKDLFISVNQVDRDSNIFELWTNANVIETNKVYYAEIPLMVNLLVGRSKKIHGIVNGGLVIGAMAWGQYTKTGTIETIGKYPTGNPYWSSTSQNNPYYKYEVTTYDQKTTSGSYYKQYNLSMRLSAGMAIDITRRTSLRISPEITKGLSDILHKNMRSKDYVTILGEKNTYAPTKTFATGLIIGIGIDL